MTQAVAPGMKAKRYGRIVNIFERRRTRHQPDRHPGLCVGQGGADRPHQAIGPRAGSVGITVNNIAPGFVRSNRPPRCSGRRTATRGRKALVDRIALKRLGASEDIAWGVLFFASEYAGGSRGRCCRSTGASERPRAGARAPRGRPRPDSGGADGVRAHPSVSTDPRRTADLHAAAAWVAGKLEAAGPFTVRTMPTAGARVVYAEWLGAANAPTALIYGHYDVQPEDRSRSGTPRPFEAHAEGRSPLRPRRIRRQGPDAHPHQGRGGVLRPTGSACPSTSSS